MTSCYFETVVTADSSDQGKCFIIDIKSRCFLTKIHFMDSQINKVHSPTIFCIVPRDLRGFWDALFFPRSDMSPTASKTAHGRVPPEFS